jgi:GT2 family glycosyltransferase
MPLGVAEPNSIRSSVESLRRQLYPHWELWLLDDSPGQAHKLSHYCDQDSRIRALPRRPLHLDAAADLVEDGWLTFLYPSDRLAEIALWELAQALANRPKAKLIYSDEDRIDETGHRFDPHFKPDWNPELAQACGYTGRLTAVLPGVLRAAGRIRVSSDGSHDAALALSAGSTGSPETIVHIPKILYHVGQPARSLCATSRPALQSFFGGSEPRAEILDGPWPGAFHLRWSLPSTPPEITLIVPTHNAAPLLEKLVRTLTEMTSYPAFEILVIDHRSDEPAARAYLDRLQREQGVKLLRYDGPFNFSAMNNLAVAECRTELVGLLNNDLEIVEASWLDEMVSHALRPGVGAVGAKLLYSDGTVQHGGVLLGGGSPTKPVAGHLFHSLHRSEPGYFGRALVAQSASAVTAACMVMRRGVFQEVGGFDEENLPVAFSDVDLCLRLGEAGYRIVWTPHAQLIHHGSTTRGHDLSPQHRQRFAAEVRHMRRRWGDRLDHDPHYNPNLDPVTCDFSLAFPPRPYQHSP